MKIQKNNNSGDVVNGDKIGLDEQGVSAMLDDKQRKLLDNARLNLSKALSEENIESKKVLSYCAEIKRFLPDDFMANFYEVACEGTEKQLNKFLGDIDIEKNRKHVKEIADFLLKGMEYSSVLPLKNLVDISLSGDEKTKYLTAIEQEAEKIKEGVYSTQVPRDVFVAYSSKDYKKVNEIVEYLEDNKITCFVALRNLRHGKGAVEHYDEALKEAMHNCDCVVFLSSNNSRSLECDALKQEIPYIRDHEPKMGRIEYLLEDYNENTSIAAKRICEKFFKNIAYCCYIDDLVTRVTDHITGFDSKSTDISEAAGKSPCEKVKYCLACGAENSKSNKFCPNCGSKDFADYQGYLNENEELKKQKPEEDGKQREVIETQAEEPKLKSPQKPENPVGQIERPESELQPPKPAYPTLENYDKNEFEIEDGILIYYKGNKTNVIIPNGVTSIGRHAFQFRTSLTSITIPDSVTSVGNMAFRGCDSLTSITVAEGNTNYSSQDGVLYNKDKTRLIRVPLAKTSVTIPNCVTSIGNGAFGSCTSLTSITIPDIVTSIGGWTFCWCKSLTNITIPDSVTSIGCYAFDGCTNLESISVGTGNQNYASQNGILYNKDKTDILFVPIAIKGSVTIPDSVTSIGSYTFSGRESLESVTIPNSVTSIGSWAFNGCTNLTSITIPDSVTSIGREAFYGCTSLTSITIPDSVTSIGKYAFSRCESLTSISIPDSVTSIGGGAFYNCTSLESITIPNSVTSIGSTAFSGCTNLESITVSDKNTKYASQDGILYNKAKTEFIHIPQAIKGSITIPNGVTSIGSYAFNFCTNLTSITIPDSVTSIGYGAFNGCANLESLIIPYIGYLHTGYTYNYEGKVEYIEPLGWLFSCYDNDGGEAVKQVFDGKYMGGNEAGKVCAYLNKFCIPKTLKYLTILSGEICSGAFYNCKNLERVTIGSSVTAIGDEAFYGCTSLTSIEIPKGVKKIGLYAFEECKNLTIYCEAEKQPETWKDNWNANCPVVWGCNKK